MSDIDPVPPLTCRGCGARGSVADVVLDLGPSPAGDYFPLPEEPSPDPLYPLSMWSCHACGLAQLTEDRTTTSEPRAIEPQALRLQALEAVQAVRASGLITGLSTVAEFPSPHGGSWLGPFERCGLRSGGQEMADVVVDSFGLMHHPEISSAITQRMRRLAPEGVLLLQFHSLEAIVRGHQWNALRHGHFAYFSLTALLHLLERAGLVPISAWQFPLYGKTLLVASARAGSAAVTHKLTDEGQASLSQGLAAEADLALDRPQTLRLLQQFADEEAAALGDQVRAATRQGKRIYAYGAASRAVALLTRAGLTAHEVRGIGDASPAKRGRTMPGSRIPIISPEDLLKEQPDEVMLMLPDLLPELSVALPALSGRWSLPLRPE